MVLSFAEIKWQHPRRKAQLKSKLEATLLQQRAGAILHSRFNFQLALFRTAGRYFIQPVLTANIEYQLEENGEKWSSLLYLADTCARVHHSP